MSGGRDILRSQSATALSQLSRHSRRQPWPKTKWGVSSWLLTLQGSICRTAWILHSTPVQTTNGFSLRALMRCGRPSSGYPTRITDRAIAR